MFFKFISNSQKEILTCSPPLSHVRDFSFFHQMITKNVFHFIYKALFVLKTFKFLYFFPSFFPVGHCFRGWSKVNPKICDVINFLNKNLIAHFVWYLRKEPIYAIETLAIYRVLNKEHFHKKIMQKISTKSWSQTTFLFWWITLSIACKKLFLKYGILKEDYQKALKKLTLFFLLNPAPFNGQDYKKQKGPGTSHCSGYEASSKKTLY